MMMVEKVIASPGEVYKPSNPFAARILVNLRLTPEDSADDIHHLTLDLQGSGINYLEGQSLGVIPPGETEDGKRHKVRLYSIASSRKGDVGDAATVSLCVKRVNYLNEQRQLQRGVASNFLCDSAPGDEVLITGPVGRKFLLPVDDSTHLIMIAVGTGIAPFRAFIHHIYREHGGWNGQVRLFFGAKTGMESVYMNQENNDIGQYFTHETFKAFQALSRAEAGKKVYVQDKIAESTSLWNCLKEGHFCFYLCGLKGLEEGVDHVFAGWAAAEGKDWAAMKAGFMEEGRWNIEVY